MDWVKWKDTWTGHVKKCPWLVGALLLGLILLLLPESKEQPVSQKTGEEEAETVEEALTRILSLVDGAGKVRVLLTEKTGEQILYQTDEVSMTGESTAERQKKTVMAENTDRRETGLVRQVNPPTFLGAVVLCQGADDPKVKLAMVEAVMRATGLGSNCISVLKMK